MSVEVIDGKVNVKGVLKDVGAKLKLSKKDEKRLVDLGFAEYIDDSDANIEDDSQDES